MRATRRARIAVLAAMVVLIGGCAVLSAVSAPLDDTWRWLAGALGIAVTVLGGGALTTLILALASDAASTTAECSVTCSVAAPGSAPSNGSPCSAPWWPADQKAWQ